MQIIKNDKKEIVAVVEAIRLEDYLAFSFVWEKFKGEVKMKGKGSAICKKLTLLSNINKSKDMQPLRKDNFDWVAKFSELLKSKGWDFEKYPNPQVYVLFIPDSE